MKENMKKSLVGQFYFQKNKEKKQMDTLTISGIGEWKMMSYFGDVSWKDIQTKYR